MVQVKMNMQSILQVTKAFMPMIISNSRSLGWCSPDSVKDWDIGTPSTIQSEIPTTNFNEINSTISSRIRIVN